MEIGSLFDTAIVGASHSHHKQRHRHSAATAIKLNGTFNDSSFVAHNESGNQDENVNNLAMLASLSLQKVLNINNINNSKSSHNGLISNGMSSQKQTSAISTTVIKVEQRQMNQLQRQEFKAENAVLKKLLKNGAVYTTTNATLTGITDATQSVSAPISIVKQSKQNQQQQQKQHANSTQKQRLNSSISSTNSSASTSSSMANSYGSFYFFTEDALTTPNGSTVETTAPTTKSSSTKLPEKLKIPSDILDDLASRFIINVPDMELNNLIRICFQIELAHWFYLDFFCAPDDPEAQEHQHRRKLPTVGFKQFAVQLFQHIPFLNKHVGNVDRILVEWKEYKLSVPTCGAILVSEDLNHCLLVQSYFARNSWGFPKGKINENENTAHCAIREVYEETGFDITDIINADDYIEAWINYQYTRLYIVCNIPLDTQFAPRTRNEIKCCDWFRIDALPVNKNDAISKAKLGKNSNSFFMIMPFVKRLKKWVNDKRAGIEPSSCRRKCSGQQSPKDILNAVTSMSPTIQLTKKKEQQRVSSRRQRHKSMGDLEGVNLNNLSGKAGCGGGGFNASNIYNSNNKHTCNNNKQQKMAAGSNIPTTITTIAKLLPGTTATTTTSKRQLFHSQSQNDAQQPTSNEKIVSSFDLIRKERQHQLKAVMTQKQHQQRLEIKSRSDKQCIQQQQLKVKSILNNNNTQKQQHTTPTTGMDLIAMLTAAAAAQKTTPEHPQRPRPASVSLNTPIATISGATSNHNTAPNAETLYKLQRSKSGSNLRILKRVQSQQPQSQLQQQHLHQQQLQQNRPFNFTPSFNSWTNFSFTKNFMANVFC